MANVRLLRQSVEDYQKELAKANAAIEVGNDTYAADFAAYQAAHGQYQTAVNTYNTLNQAKAAQGTSLYSDSYVAALLAQQKAEEAFALANGFKYSDEFVAPTFEYRRADGSTYRSSTPPVASPGPEPVAPVAPVQTQAAQVTPPTPPNLTASNIREMADPGLNQAGVAMQNARGLIGKSQLAGEAQPAMRGSAFSDQQDPQGLKERGVLARVMGGQL